MSIKMRCQCAERVNRHLNEHGESLELFICVDDTTGKVFSRTFAIRTMKIVKSNNSLSMVFAAFCPCCGKRLYGDEVNDETGNGQMMIKSDAFKMAIERICGGELPFAVAYPLSPNDEVYDRLVDWILNQAPMTFFWATATGVIEAAERMVETAASDKRVE